MSNNDKRRECEKSLHMRLRVPLLSAGDCGRRSMINIPRLLGSGRRRAQRWQRVVQHPQATIFSAVADVGAYSEFLPWCLSSQVSSHRTAEDGASTMNAEVVVGYGPLRSSFHSVVELTPNRRVHAVSSPNEHIEELSFTWDFAPLSDGACRLDLMLGTAPPGPGRMRLRRG